MKKTHKITNICIKECNLIHIHLSFINAIQYPPKYSCSVRSWVKSLLSQSSAFGLMESWFGLLLRVWQVSTPGSKVKLNHERVPTKVCIFSNIRLRTPYTVLYEGYHSFDVNSEVSTYDLKYTARTFRQVKGKGGTTWW